MRTVANVLLMLGLGLLFILILIQSFISTRAQAIITLIGIIVIVLWGLFTYFASKADKKKGIPDRSIVGVEYLGIVDEVEKRGGFRGALLGGLLFGPLGAPIGALLPMGTKPVCRFAVTYGDGSTEIRDCVKDSRDYNYLNQYIIFGSFKRHK